jgi:hypothetical protein
VNQHPCTVCGGRGAHAGAGHAYTTDPAMCPERGGGMHRCAPLDAQCIDCQRRLEARDGKWCAVGVKTNVLQEHGDMVKYLNAMAHDLGVPELIGTNPTFLGGAVQRDVRRLVVAARRDHGTWLDSLPRGDRRDV